MKARFIRYEDTRSPVFPPGTRVARQNVRLSTGQIGNVLHNAGTGEWFEVAAIGRGLYRVLYYVGADCPCGG